MAQQQKRQRAQRARPVAEHGRAPTLDLSPAQLDDLRRKYIPVVASCGGHNSYQEHCDNCVFAAVGAYLTSGGDRETALEFLRRIPRDRIERVVPEVNTLVAGDPSLQVAMPADLWKGDDGK